MRQFILLVMIVILSRFVQTKIANTFTSIDSINTCANGTDDEIWKSYGKK